MPFIAAICHVVDSANLWMLQAFVFAAELIIAQDTTLRRSFLLPKRFSLHHLQTDVTLDSCGSRVIQES